MKTPVIMAKYGAGDAETSAFSACPIWPFAGPWWVRIVSVALGSALLGAFLLWGASELAWELTWGRKTRVTSGDGLGRGPGARRAG